MSLVFADRTQETTTTTGTGTINLGGATTQCQSLIAAVGNGNSCDYCLLSGNGTDWETGNGTVTSGSPNTLSRTTIYASSNSGNAISLSGTSTVFLSLPAARVGPAWSPQTVSGSGGTITIGGTTFATYQVTSWSNPGSGSLVTYALSFTRITTGSTCGLLFINGSNNGYFTEKQGDGNYVVYRLTSGAQNRLGAENSGGAGTEANAAGPWATMLTVEISGASNNSFSAREFGYGGVIYTASDANYDFTSGSWNLYVLTDNASHTTIGSLYQADNLAFPFGL